MTAVDTGSGGFIQVIRRTPAPDADRVAEGSDGTGCAADPRSPQLLITYQVRRTR